MWYLDLNAIHVKSDQNMKTRESTVTLLTDERFENVMAPLDACPQLYVYVSSAALKNLIPLHPAKKIQELRNS